MTVKPLYKIFKHELYFWTAKQLIEWQDLKANRPSKSVKTKYLKSIELPKQY